ncbi:hypothetical protein B0H16DRAFT_1476780 [Mycena metata]|uniref:Uncharacterized protein n=1 Tax=Mycena metata TaxID=1033252 RepID=A0AAD7MHE9_9AGAR|nr:hypothetical protein B0H16DRAFT_1476780 [Mycena metata]
MMRQSRRLDVDNMYKGAIPTNTLLDILKKHSFDLPAGIESNPADFAKVIAALQEVLTQLRAKFKKALAASLRATKNDKKIAPGPEHQNIFKLTQIFVDGTQCKVTIELCARVALMRSVFLQDSGPKFWDTLDSSLAAIRAEAQGNAKKITKAFRHVLTQDQKDHGINDYEISDAGVDSFQQEVDDLIAAGTANLASSVTSAEEIHRKLGPVLRTVKICRPPALGAMWAAQLATSRNWTHAGPIGDWCWYPVSVQLESSS